MEILRYAVPWATIAMAFIAVGFGSSHPAQAQQLTGAARFSELYRVILTEDSATCCPRNLVFAAENLDTGEKRELSFSARMEELADFRIIAEDQLLVTGRLRYGGDILLLGDLQSGQPKDTIWAYGWDLSPSGKYVIYNSHYPRLGPEKKSLVLLYDLSASAEENRLKGWSDTYFSNGPGRPVYPPLNALRSSYALSLADRRISVSPFVWTEDEQAILFLDKEIHDTRELTSLVLLHLNGPQVLPGIWQHPLPIHTWLSPQPHRTWQEMLEQDYAAEALEPTSDGRILIHTHPSYDMFPERIQIDLPSRDRATAAVPRDERPEITFSEGDNLILVGDAPGRPIYPALQSFRYPNDRPVAAKLTLLSSLAWSEKRAAILAHSNHLTSLVLLNFSGEAGEVPSIWTRPIDALPPDGRKLEWIELNELRVGSDYLTIRVP